MSYYCLLYECFCGKYVDTMVDFYRDEINLGTVAINSLRILMRL